MSVAAMNLRPTASRATPLPAGLVGADICEGEFQSVGTSRLDVHCTRMDAGEYKLGRLTANDAFGFRRSWQASRNDRSATTLIWFVRKGQMDVVYAGRRDRVRAGQCCFMLSSKAFYIEVLEDAGDSPDIVYLSAPSHKFHHALYDRVRMGVACHAGRREVALAGETLALFFAGEPLVPAHAENLIEVLLQGVVHSAELQFGCPTPPPSISEMRVAEIMRCINRDFTNPDLSVQMIANHCGISKRYVIMALKQKSICFSDMVWDRRIEAAAEWLADPAMAHHGINILAYRAGFKSAAHFSRKFKKRRGATPSDYRYRAFSSGGLSAEAA